MAISPKTSAVNPKEWRAFKVWITVYPVTNRVNTEPPRLTIYREMGRLAVAGYEQLRDNALIKLPESPSSATTGRGSLISGLTGSFSYTPQIGNNEPYIYVMGHFHSVRDIKNPYSTKPVYSGGVLYDTQGGYPHIGPPNPNVLEDVKDLKGIIDTEMTASLPASVDYNVDKLDYLGIIFGAGGLHFPR
jgi:hypothetical protein